MTSATDIAAEQEQGLALLFQRGLDLALRMQEDAMAAGTADERARLAAAFHRISRGVRQTAALRVRIAREVGRAQREDHAEVVRLDDRRATRRKAQVRATLERLIWTEAENDDSAEAMVDHLETLLGEDDLYGRLSEGEVESHIVRLRAELGLSPPAVPGEGAEAGVEPSSAWGAAFLARPEEGGSPAVTGQPFQSSG
ncbi:MAG TPA: hypothetical protein VGC92_14665 [Phenylobacterium sp.]|jgi:hypothetical protein